ncbi:MAG: hypothetical protein OIF50_02075 [Flavobacteriaceae bacterium]|nr:hypothetical protein [Flavobacteriaceae bacterium]
MNLYKCTFLKSSNNIPKGTNVEIIKDKEPDSDDIKNAIERKYGIKVSSFHCSTANWEIVQN